MSTRNKIVSIFFRLRKSFGTHRHVPVLAELSNLLLVMVCFALCRVLFVAWNWDASFGDKAKGLYGSVFFTGIEFDLWAAVLVNAPYFLIAMIPFAAKGRRRMAKALKIFFVLTNGLVFLLMLGDMVLFHYTSRRIEVWMLQEMAHQTNLLRIAAEEIPTSWPLLLLFIALCVILWFGYVRPVEPKKMGWRCGSCLGGLILFGYATGVSAQNLRIFCPTEELDGSFLSLNVENHRHRRFALNTPYELYKSMEDKEIEIPEYFSSEQLEDVFPVTHRPAQNAEFVRKNVVVVIWESLSSAMTRQTPDSTYASLTPFLDQLAEGGARFRRTVANGSISIDAIPSIFASTPRLKKPFVLTRFSADTLVTLPRLLAKKGYESAFFHGGEDNSMGFRNTALSMGFDRYLGRSDYEADQRFGGKKDFDGTWAIWDEPFLQFVCAKISDMREPFVAGVFTATSHHPYALPAEVAEEFRSEGEENWESAVRYTDWALCHFFASASRQPWYDNTIFVITGDHPSAMCTRKRRVPTSQSSSVPIIIYDPSRSLAQAGERGLAQQTDIMPTILPLMGYDQPFRAFGKNALDTLSPQWAFNYVTLPRYKEGRYSVDLLPGGKSRLYDDTDDPRHRKNLADSLPEVNSYMTNRARAALQQAATLR